MTDDAYVIDLVPDELALARGQLASGLAPIAEATLRRRIAEIGVEGGSRDELDAAQALLAEALWRQGRHRAAGAALDGIRPSSIERQRPLVGIIAAEAAAASGDPDAAARGAESVLASTGIDDAWRIRSGVPGRVAWPVPASMRPGTRRPGKAEVRAPTLVVNGKYRLNNQYFNTPEDVIGLVQFLVAKESGGAKPTTQPPAKS